MRQKANNDQLVSFTRTKSVNLLSVKSIDPCFMISSPISIPHPPRHSHQGLMDVVHRMCSGQRAKWWGGRSRWQPLAGGMRFFHLVRWQATSTARTVSAGRRNWKAYRIGFNPTQKEIKLVLKLLTLILVVFTNLAPNVSCAF